MEIRERTIALALCVACSAGVAAQSPVRLDGSRSDPRLAPAGAKVLVFVFTSTDCPISNRYAPEIRRLASRFAPDGVAFRLIYPNPSDKPDAIHEHMTAFGFVGAAEAFHDPEQALARFAGVRVTPEAAVYAAGRIVYHGRIDDRYVDLGRERPAATIHDLADALVAVTSGKPVLQPVTQAVGCFIADFKR